MNYVSYYDSLRFANWLHNGQPVGAPDHTTTEDGAYTFSGTSTVSERNAGATIFLTSEDEWYKAAYFNASSSAFFDYPAGTDVQTVCADPGATANTANCGDIVGNLTDVGSYTGSASPHGTFDQGGNVWECSGARCGTTSDDGTSDDGDAEARVGAEGSYIALFPCDIHANICCTRCTDLGDSRVCGFW